QAGELFREQVGGRLNVFAVYHNVQVAVELVTDGLDHFRMAVPDMTDANTGNQVEIPTPIRRVQIRSFRVLDGQHERRRRGLGQVCEKGFSAEIQGVVFPKSMKTAYKSKRPRIEAVKK